VSPIPSNPPVRLLLINPALPESFWSFRWWIDMVPGKRAINLPLGLATLAALCPPDWQVSIVDENAESLPLDPLADLIGVCGMGVQFERQREILRYYRRRGYRTVVGGSELLHRREQPLHHLLRASLSSYQPSDFLSLNLGSMGIRTEATVSPRSSTRSTRKEALSS